MKRNVSKMIVKVTDLAYNVSKLAACSASWWGFFQPKEPYAVKILNEKTKKVN